MKIKLIARHDEYTLEIEGRNPAELVQQYKDVCWELGLPVHGGKRIKAQESAVELALRGGG